MSNDVRNQVFQHGSNLIKEQMAVDVPVDSVPLPSKGKVYDPAGPLHKREVVEVRAMTAREEDILMSQHLVKKGTVVSHLIRSCLVEKDLPVEQMLSGDRYAIMVAMRLMSYGPKYDAVIECPQCGEKQEQEFDLSQLPIKALEIDPVVVGKNEFAFDLPSSKKRVTFKFMTGYDEEALTQAQLQRKAKLRTEIDSPVTSHLLQTLVSVDGNSDRGTVSRFVNTMLVADSSALRRFMSKHEPGVDMTQVTVCRECGSADEVDIPIGVGFFHPKR